MSMRKDNSTRNCCSNTLLVLCLSAAMEKLEDESEAAGTRPSKKKQGSRGSLLPPHGQQPDGNTSSTGVKMGSFRVRIKTTSSVGQAGDLT